MAGMHKSPWRDSKDGKRQPGGGSGAAVGGGGGGTTFVIGRKGQGEKKIPTVVRGGRRRFEGTAVVWIDPAGKDDGDEEQESSSLGQGADREQDGCAMWSRTWFGKARWRWTRWRQRAQSPVHVRLQTGRCWSQSGQETVLDGGGLARKQRRASRTVQYATVAARRAGGACFVGTVRADTGGAGRRPT